MSVLEIRDLHVSVGEGDDAKEILKGVDLTVRSGETHAIMGPNGSGKSTLAYSIAGHPKYTITGGTVTLDGEVDEVDGAPTIECAMHGSCFDLRTGEPTNLPATEPVPVYPVRVEGDDVYVDLSADAATPLAAASN